MALRGTLALARTLKNRLAPTLVARRAFATPVVVGQVRHASIFHALSVAEQPNGKKRRTKRGPCACIRYVECQFETMYPAAQPTVKSGVWAKEHFSRPEGTPDGFKLRAAPAVSSLPAPEQDKSVEVFLETWEAGSAEPPHAHPG